MKENYAYEPSRMEVLITSLVGSSLAQPYYSELVKGMGISPGDKVLDYCSGGGNIAREISKYLLHGQLVYADVSEKWLSQTAKKLMYSRYSLGERITGFTGKLSGGEYDKILVHFSLHDFPGRYRLMIINQLIDNLKPGGRLFIREPLDESHGILLYELINLLEYTKRLSYEYKIVKSRFAGEYADIKAILK